MNAHKSSATPARSRTSRGYRSPFYANPQAGQIDFSFFNNFFSGILGSIASLLRSIFNFLWTALVTIANFIWTALVVAVQFILRMLGHVGRFFRNIWDGVIKRGLVKILEFYAWLKERLERIFGPVLRWLRKMRQLYDEWFKKYVKPVLNAIQRVRRVLRVLRLFNVKWAQALDSRLGRLESRIVRNFRTIRSKMNEIIGWLEILQDPAGLIRSTVLGRSILAALGEVLDVFGVDLPWGYPDDPNRNPNAARDLTNPNRTAADYTLATERQEGWLGEIREDALTFYNALFSS